MVTATMELLAELETTDGLSAERWAALLDLTAKLFLCSDEKLTAHQGDLFDDVFVQLMRGVDTQALTRLSLKLSDAKRTLPQTTWRLAFDENECVSAPMLKSRYVTRELLLRVVQSRGKKHRLAIASRYSVDPTVSEALAKCDDPAVHRALAENRGVKMSETGWARLAQLGESDRDLATILLRRSDLPGPLKRKLHAKLEDARMRVLNGMPGVMRDEIENAIAANNTSSETLPLPESPEFTSAQAKMVKLNKKGKLNDSTLNRFAVYREYVEVTAALALLTGSPIEIIRTLVTSDKVEGLVLACKAGRLNWATTTTIVKNRPGTSPISAWELEKAKETFESISLSAAQRTVRF
jgi:uncharacterized protein (DUF2336 family)